MADEGLLPAAVEPPAATRPLTKLTGAVGSDRPVGRIDILSEKKYGDTTQVINAIPARKTVRYLQLKAVLTGGF